MCDRLDAITEVPSERWDAEPWLCDDPRAPGKMVTRWGSFVRDVSGFDASFIPMSAREARQMSSIRRRVGKAVSFPHALRIRWALRALRSPSIPRVRPGSSPCTLRVKAFGEVNLGGVNLILTPHRTIQMTKFGAMNPDGKFAHSTLAGTEHHGSWRVVVRGRHRPAIENALRALVRGEKTPVCVPERAPRLVFLFTGQGLQWAGMRRDLLADEPVFRETVWAIQGTGVAVGVYLSPRQEAIAGAEVALSWVVATLARQGSRALRMGIHYTSHSAEMDPVLPELSLAIHASMILPSSSMVA